MKTNEGRVCNFGPENLASLTPKLLSSKRGRISGIYHDALRLESGHITAIGLTYQPQMIEIGEPLPPQLSSNSYPSGMIGSPIGIFKSQALLRDVNTLKVCRVDDGCCSGMKIEYADSTVATLGRWFEALRDCHEVIYDVRQDRKFNKLRFWVAETVQSVSAKQLSSNDSLGSKKVVSQGKMLVWWYSEFSDVIVSRRLNPEN